MLFCGECSQVVAATTEELIGGLVDTDARLDTTFVLHLRRKNDHIHNTVSLVNDSCDAWYSSSSSPFSCSSVASLKSMCV